MANELKTFEFTWDADTNIAYPWRNKIYPGNYVTQLNAYRDQGVVALPGAVFFRGVGALVLNPDTDDVLNTDGELVNGTYNLQVLSPDLRQDDKPRRDRPFTIPKGAVVYKIATAAPGVREATPAGSATITPAGLTTPTPVAATAGADGFFTPAGEWSLFTSILDGSGLTGDPTAVTVTVANGPLVAAQKPSAGACRKSPSAIIVEVCYFLPDAAPSADEVWIPFGIEAGQGF